MSNTQVRYNTNNMQVDKHSQPPKKRKLSTNSSYEVNKKRPGPTSKRYKVLLTCVVCNGDAHGNLKIIIYLDLFFNYFI